MVLTFNLLPLAFQTDREREREKGERANETSERQLDGKVNVLGCRTLDKRDSPVLCL